MKTQHQFYSIVTLLLGVAESHVRLECPPPLSAETGEKMGPCDVASDDGSMPAFELTPNALNTITWVESIGHPGAPARFALSRDFDGENLLESELEFEQCVLLDHIPHDVFSKPNFMDETSWHRSTITLFVPDVKCERCYLQLISIMSDSLHGVPNDTKCSYTGAQLTDEFPACPVVYHSCAPVSIDGSVPRNELDVCDTAQFEETLQWPMKPTDNEDLYRHSVYLNRADVGMYEQTDFRLLKVGKPLTDAMCTNPLYCDPETSFEEIMAVPETAPYTLLEGACAAMVTSPVEPYSNEFLPQLDVPPVSTETKEDEISAPVDEEEKKEEEPSTNVNDEETEDNVSGSLQLAVNFALYATASVLVLVSF